MKRFSVILLILIAISMVFVSCNSEAASNSSDVAKVAVGLGSSKALSATYFAESLPSADELVWKYTASKDDNGFRTGVTDGETPIRLDNNGKGLPGVIGQNGTAGSGTWFSTGNWLFSFYGYKDSVLVYEATGVAVTVNPATQNNNIGGTANITLSIHTDPRSDCKVMMSPITVDFGNGFDSNATYILKVADNGSDVVTNLGGVANNNVVTFSRESALISYNANQLGSIHLLTFTVTKNNDTNNTVYASGEIAIWARKGYTWTISGNLSSLESVAQVGVNTVVVPTDTAQPTTTISIGNEAELKAFAAYVNQGNTCEGLTIELTHDITLTSAWTPIGNSARKTADKYFAGTFDGNNKTITGLTLSAETDDLKYDANETDASAPGISFNEYIFGLFGVVKNATIKDLTLANVSIANLYREIDTTHRLTGENVGALIGYSEGNLNVTGVTVSSGSVAAGSNVAGIIGRAYGNGGTAIVIENCTNNADITATNGSGNKAKAAGIVGFINTNGCPSASITGCSNTGAISSTATGHVIASGIANYGFQTSSGNTEEITITGTNSGTVTVSQGAALTSTDSIAALCSYMNAEDTISINPSNN